MDYKLTGIQQMKTYQLPNTFKKIGLGLFIISFIAMFIVAFTSNDDFLKTLTKYGILIGLLIVSISKEEIEDEFITNLRMQSYTFAFILGVIYALVLPFIDYSFDLMLNAKDSKLEDIGDWNILWVLLFVQVFFFHYLKRAHK